MNIKGVLPNPIASIERPSRIDGKSRMQSSAGDRDADGRRERPDPDLKRQLNQEEFDEALSTLSDLPGMKSSQLTLRVEAVGYQRVVLIIDPEGRTVRRLTESQLWSATRDKDRPTGKILDKAM